MEIIKGKCDLGRKENKEVGRKTGMKGQREGMEWRRLRYRWMEWGEGVKGPRNEKKNGRMERMEEIKQGMRGRGVGQRKENDEKLEKEGGMN